MTLRPDATYRELLEESLPDRTDPRYRLNLEYALEAIDRGREIVEIVAKYRQLAGSRVLDLGCGEGGVAIAFALAGAEVTALDIDPARLGRMGVWASEHRVSVQGMTVDAHSAGLADGVFDIVICNDFMEHVERPASLAKEIDRLLVDGGLLYLSNQNRLSLFGLLSDPHYRLFGVTWMPRWLANYYVVRVRRRVSQYTVFTIPTDRSLRKVFRDTDLVLESIAGDWLRRKIENPQLVKSRIRRTALRVVKAAGLEGLILNLLVTLPGQFLVDFLIYVGEKNPEPPIDVE